MDISSFHILIFYIQNITSVHGARELHAPLDRRPQREVQVGPDKLEVVSSFCKLGDMLSAPGDNAPCQWNLAINKAKPPASAAKGLSNDLIDLQCKTARHCHHQV